MPFDNWVLDASMSKLGMLCFTPIKGDIKDQFEIVSGFNMITTLNGRFPKGKIVAIIHKGGDNLVNFWLKENKDVETAILLHNKSFNDYNEEKIKIPIKK